MSVSRDTDSLSYSRRIMDALCLDPVLLALLLILAGFGSMVLYSATGADTVSVLRQATRITVALLLLVDAGMTRRSQRCVKHWLAV